MNRLSAYQIDWLRANMPSFSYVERTTGNVIRESRACVAEQLKTFAATTTGKGV